MKAQRLSPDQAQGPDGIVAYGPTRLRGNPARRHTPVPTSHPLATGVAKAHRREQPPQRRCCHVCGTEFPPKSARQVVCGRVCAVAHAREHLGDSR